MKKSEILFLKQMGGVYSLHGRSLHAVPRVLDPNHEGYITDRHFQQTGVV